MMKLKMVDDATLSKEAFLIYRYNAGFSPDHGNLHRWIGRISDSSGNPVEVLVEIPHDFPHRPPSVRILNGSHPSADPEGYLHTRRMRRWRSDYHVFQIIKEAETLIRGGRLQIIASSPSHSTGLNLQKEALKTQVQQLEAMIAEKQKELMQVQNSPVNEINRKQLVEDTLLDLETALDQLEDQFDDVEISETEFAKKFFKLRKKYYLIKMAS